MKDLVILAADKDLEHALKGLLARPEALGIRPGDADIFVEPEHDPACALRGVDFLGNLSAQYGHGLLVFDHKGSGREAMTPQDLQTSLNKAFAGSVWGERARAVVLSPDCGKGFLASMHGWAFLEQGYSEQLVPVREKQSQQINGQDGRLQMQSGNGTGTSQPKKPKLSLTMR